MQALQLLLNYRSPELLGRLFHPHPSTLELPLAYAQSSGIPESACSISLQFRDYMMYVRCNLPTVADMIETALEEAKTSPSESLYAMVSCSR